jgi:hypothetical protein
MFMPGVTASPSSIRTSPLETLMRSTGTTASQPAGSMAPVMISMQWSGEASASGGSPAACVPCTRSVCVMATDAEATAMPSMDTRSKGGWSRSA